MSQQIDFKKVESKISVSKKRKIKIVGGICLPNDFLLLFHNQDAGKLIIKHQSLISTTDCIQPNNLVTAVNLSNLSIYFSFLPELDQIEAYTQLITLVAKIGQASISEFGGGLLPIRVKQAYLATVSFLRTLCEGVFVTDIFVQKLCNLVKTIWRHGQNYLLFCRNHIMSIVPSYQHQELSTSFVN
mgnify:CR=1 FL=1